MVSVVYPTNLWIAGVLFVGLVEGQSCSYRSLVKKQGDELPEHERKFLLKKRDHFKRKGFFWKGSSSKPIIFFRAHFVSFSFVFFKDCKKNRQETRIPKKKPTSEFPPFHVSLSGFLLVKLARVKPRISRIGIDYILRRLEIREKNPQQIYASPQVLMVRWKMAMWWKVTTYYWRDIPFLTEPWLWEVSGNIMNWPLSKLGRSYSPGRTNKKKTIDNLHMTPRPKFRVKQVSEMDAKKFQKTSTRWASPAKAIAKLPKSGLEFEPQKTHPELTSSSVD